MATNVSLARQLENRLAGRRPTSSGGRTDPNNDGSRMWWPLGKPATPDLERLLGRYWRLEPGNQFRDVPLQRVPDDLWIDVAVVVHQVIAHADHLAPWDLGV